MLKLPTTIVSDLAIHDNDPDRRGTYGRGIWVLDDFAVLRPNSGGPVRGNSSLQAERSVRVRPQCELTHALPEGKCRRRRNPPQEPSSLTPSAAPPSADIAIDVLGIREASIVRHLSSALPPPVREARARHGKLWLRRRARCPRTLGSIVPRGTVRYDPPPAFAHAFGLQRQSRLRRRRSLKALWPLPGRYRIRLTVDGRPVHGSRSPL